MAGRANLQRVREKKKGKDSGRGVIEEGAGKEERQIKDERRKKERELKRKIEVISDREREKTTEPQRSQLAFFTYVAVNLQSFDLIAYPMMIASIQSLSKTDSL